MPKKKAAKPARKAPTNKRPVAAVARPASKPGPGRAAAAAPAATSSLVLYELRDMGGMVRVHSDHADLERARIAARHLTNSPDVAQAWIVTNVETVRAGA